MTSLSLQKANLTFTVRKQGRLPLKEMVVSYLQGKHKYPKPIQVHALKGIDLELKEGDRLGILGHNGSGKSVLLRMLAGIYPPTAGKREAQGRIVSLFDIGLGFEMEATGWENITYRSYVMGMTPADVAEKREEIAEFTELKDALDLPIRCYSPGMLIRLAFAISTAVEPEILLVDEILSVGDIGFQKKAHERMLEMMDRAKIMVMVSHDLGAIQDVCNRAIWMNRGNIHAQGDCKTLIEQYSEAMKPAEPAPAPSEPEATSTEDSTAAAA
ncbi:O-antigen export system ATP-binding protein rfbE [Planctomycetales bacterium 10988]|nr:O-antigen export system ATP-binding protein rfbE [Planctomycetales bacterium 10988]